MKTNSNLFLKTVLIGALAGLSGCATILYVPNSQNVPLFTGKHEAKAEVNTCSETDGYSSLIIGANFQGAYAVSDHVGIMSNFFVAGGEDFFSGESGSGGLFEGGAGYFLNLSKHVVFETYGGMGLGWVKHVSMLNTVTTEDKVNGQRLFVQPAIGFTSKYFNAVFSLRSCAAFYNNPPAPSTDEFYSLTANNKSAMMMEPAITLRAGLEHVKFQTQFGVSFNLNNQLQDMVYSTVGICFCFSPKNKHTNTTGINQN